MLAQEKRPRSCARETGGPLTPHDVGFMLLMVWKQESFLSCSTLTRPGKNEKKKKLWWQTNTIFSVYQHSCSFKHSNRASVDTLLSVTQPAFLPSVHSFAQLGSLRVRVIFSFTLNEDLIELNLVKATWCWELASLKLDSDFYILASSSSNSLNSPWPRRYFFCYCLFEKKKKRNKKREILSALDATQGWSAFCILEPEHFSCLLPASFSSVTHSLSAQICFWQGVFSRGHLLEFFFPHAGILQFFVELCGSLFEPLGLFFLDVNADISFSVTGKRIHWVIT